MIRYDVVIIGGGLGGLTAGATLTRLGKKVLLLEQHYLPGGCATTFKRKDYVMEVSLHEMDGLYKTDIKSKIFRFLGVSKSIQFEQIPELYRFKNSRFDVVMPHGFENAVAMLSDKYPEESPSIQKLFRLIEGVLREKKKFGRSKKSLKRALLLPFTFPNLYTASRYTLGKWLDKNIKNEELKIILQANLLYYHDDPHTMSMLFYATAQAGYYKGGGHFIHGGSQKLSNHLQLVIEQNGGCTLLGKKAVKILVEKGKVSGVVYKDTFNESLQEEKVLASAVIGNAAIPLLVDLLPESYQGSLKRKVSSMSESCSLISIYIGFKSDIKKLGSSHYSTIILDDSVTKLQDIRANYTGSWGKRAFVFVDYSQINSGLAPKGKSVGVISTSDYWSEWQGLSQEEYANRKEALAQTYFQRLEEHLPGITKEIDCYEVGTSKTIQEYTLNPKGTPYGFAQIPKQSGLRRFAQKSDIENLYFASAWTNPGGGFSGAIISGFLCALAVDKKIDAAKISYQNKDARKDSRIVALRERRIIAENTFELVFAKPKGFNFVAGQYAVMALSIQKKFNLDVPFRALSIVSHPDEDVVRFAMRNSDSAFKKSCIEMMPGDEATIYGPMGKMIVDKLVGDLVFLTAGIGITPVLPLLKDLEKNGMNINIYLFYSNKNKAQAAYHQFFNDLRRGNFKYKPVFTEIDKRINRDLLQSTIPNFQNCTYYIIGSTGFIKSMKQLLTEERVSPTQIIVDDFG